MIQATREYSHEGKVKIEVVVLFREDGSLRPIIVYLGGWS